MATKKTTLFIRQKMAKPRRFNLIMGALHLVQIGVK
jgi:hypothetical protein